MRKFLVTVERDGKRWVKIAKYANAHWIEWSDEYDGDDIDDNGGKRWTGWLEDRQNFYGDELIMDVDGAVVAWMPLPAPHPANARASSAGANGPTSDAGAGSPTAEAGMED
jgi:hypothetical protein